MSDDVFRAWTGYELSGGRRGGKTEPMVLSAFAEALKGKKVLVVTPQGNVLMELQPAAPEPEIIVDDPEFQIAERVRAVEDEWIDVEDDLPSISDDEFYLARFTEAFLSTPGMYNRRPAEVVSGKYLNNFARNYTHWMPVPALNKPKP